jgi:uncharacterized protein (TIGR03067 family)
MLQLKISQPTPREIVPLGSPLTVTGQATDRGGSEPITIESVTVALDNAPAVRAKLKNVPNQPLTTVSFVATVQVPSMIGPHTVTVIATNDQGFAVTQIVTIFAGRSVKQPQNVAYRHLKDECPLLLSPIKVDPTKHPKVLDASVAKDKVAAGIYELEDDVFTLCYAQPGRDRPTDFKAKEGSGHSLSVWKRVKK